MPNLGNFWSKPKIPLMIEHMWFESVIIFSQKVVASVRDLLAESPYESFGRSDAQMFGSKIRAGRRAG